MKIFLSAAPPAALPPSAGLHPVLADLVTLTAASSITYTVTVGEQFHHRQRHRVGTLKRNAEKVTSIISAAGKGDIHHFCCCAGKGDIHHFCC
jgi:hypothetical protein